MSQLPEGVSKRWGDTGDLAEVTVEKAKEIRLWKDSHGQWVLDFTMKGGDRVRIDLTTHVVSRTVCEPWIKVIPNAKNLPKEE
jgi:hypothetical protein